MTVLAITAFEGNHRFLSNFAVCPSLEYQGRLWMTSEHAYQAMKSEDEDYREMIHRAASPGKAKRLSKFAPHFVAAAWDARKRGIMREIVYLKFKDPALARLLVLTAPAELIEGNNWGDRFWGACWEHERWVGENHLGKILMDIREALHISPPRSFYPSPRD